MADSKTETPTLTLKFFTSENATFGTDRRVVVRMPITVLKLASAFAGPFSKHWLYISALAYASLAQYETKLVPYQPDAMTVTDLVYNDNGECVWTVAENLYDRRSWNMATDMIVSMSGAQYGGRAKIIEVKGCDTIRSEHMYTDHIFNEGVHIIPMVPGRIVTTSMAIDAITCEFEINPRLLYALRRDGSDPQHYNYKGAFANACFSNEKAPSEHEWVPI